jgi:ribosomal protein S18 acetylase RimI-like enzyme
MDQRGQLKLSDMEIKKYQPNKIPSLEFTELLRKKYGKSKNLDFFMSDYQKAFDFCTDNENITFIPISIYEGQEMKAHIALIVDKRLPSGEAFFGFLEVPDDILTFRSLWDNLVEEARNRGILVLKGPVNGSIWHQYRCIKETDDSEFFKSELFCESYYYDFLSSIKPTSELIYYSAYREHFDVVLPVIQPAYEKLASGGFSIKEMKDVSIEILQTLASLSRTVFKNSWGFTELNQKEFLELYSSDKLDSLLEKLYLLYKGKEIVGFCSTFREDDSTLICKTICILPEYQGLGMGNALAFKVHIDAKEQGIKKIIYALIREGNNIKNFPKEDVVVFRRYSAFEFNI